MKLKSGLEYEMAYRTSNCGDLFHEREIVDDDDGNILFLYHTGFTGRGNFERSRGYELLKFRADNTAKYIKSSPHYAKGNYEQSFIEAFERMDQELEKLVEKVGWDAIPLSAEYLWRTRYNTVIVLLHNEKQLYIAGASHLHVILIRGSETVLATSQRHIDQSIILRRSLYGGPNPKETARTHEYPRYLRMANKTIQEHPQLYYYKSLTVKDTDEYLIAACDNILESAVHIPGFGGPLPQALRNYVEIKGFEYGVEQLAMRGSCDSESIMFSLRLCSRKRERESSSDSEVTEDEEMDTTEGEYEEMDEDDSSA